jgi:hypothetical protein
VNLPNWSGQTVAVLGAGPSMSQALADRSGSLTRIAVNNSYRLAPDSEVIYAGDGGWWNRTPQALLCPGLKLTLEPFPRIRPAVPPGVEVLRNTGREGYDPRPFCIRTHNNGGMQAVQVAIHAGAARVLLLGFDMRPGHWHEPHPEGETSERQFGIWITRARRLAEAVCYTVDIVNCTEGSALDCFRFQTLDSILHERLAA